MVKDQSTIIISKETHLRVKKFCRKSGYIISGWVDNVLKEKLNKLNDGDNEN